MAKLAGWNDDLLASELMELTALELDFDFSFELTGFDTADVDRPTAPKVVKPANDTEEIVAELSATAQR